MDWPAYVIIMVADGLVSNVHQTTEYKGGYMFSVIAIKLTVLKEVKRSATHGFLCYCWFNPLTVQQNITVRDNVIDVFINKIFSLFIANKSIDHC